MNSLFFATLVDMKGPRASRHLAGPTTQAAAAVVIFGGALAAVRYWLPGPELTLSYLRVLIWPTVVLVALLVLRDRLVEKFQQLVEAAGWGVNLRFQERQAQERTADAEEVLEGVLDADQTADDSTPRRTDEHALSTDTREGSPTPDQPDSEQSIPRPKNDHSPDEGTSIDPRADQETDTGPAANEEPRPEYVAALERRLEELRQQREGERRADVERAFREGAAWGWDMAGIGFKSRPVPVIEWSADGRPEIKYGEGQQPVVTPPKAQKKTMLDHLVAGSQLATRVRRLEDEIRRLEIRDASPTMALHERIGQEHVIGKLKKQLRDLDPSSPYAH